MNYILERINQVVANLVRTFNLENNYLDEDEPWSEILASTAFTVRNKYHTTLQFMPDQLRFGRDLILNTPFIVDWVSIRIHKQKIIDKKNNNENHKPHSYKVCEKILGHKKIANKYKNTYIVTYPITKVWTHVNVTILWGVVEERINIIRIKPYHKE